MVEREGEKRGRGVLTPQKTVEILLAFRPAIYILLARRASRIHSWPFGPGIYLEHGGKGGGEKGEGGVDPPKNEFKFCFFFFFFFFFLSTRPSSGKISKCSADPQEQVEASSTIFQRFI